MSRQPRSRPGAWERAVLVAVCGPVAGGCALLTGGALAGLVSGGAWLWPGVDETGQTVVGLLGNPGDPSAAYPPGQASGVPRPVVFWTVRVVLAVTGAMVAFRCGGDSAPRT